MERALTAMPSFEELTADPLGAPVRVLGRHDGDQLTDLGFHARSAQRTAGAPAPEQAPALAMPAEHGGPDQEEVASPVPVEATDDEPEQKSLSRAWRRGRRRERRATWSCWRRSRFSRRRRWRLWTAPARAARRRWTSSIIRGRVADHGHRRQGR